MPAKANRPCRSAQPGSGRLTEAKSGRAAAGRSAHAATADRRATGSPPVIHNPVDLSVPDIAAELFLSPHTIKSQMKSIYRKLDASTRNQVVTRARELGLLES
jgi:regulatory LuxR family protein